MNSLTIKRNGAVLHTLTIDKNTIVTDRLMVEHTVSLNVTLPSALDLAVGDYVEHNGERYALLELPEYSLHDGAYSYSNVVFAGNLHQLSEWMVDDEGQNEYYYNGTLSEHIDWVLAIINSKETGWTAVKPSMNGINQSPRNINYGGCSCLGLLQKLCDKDGGFSIEFDIRARVITFEREIRRPTNISFSYGRGKGLYSITRGKLSGDKIATRLYGYGGSQNVANSKRLSFEGKYVERNVAKYGLKEDRVTFDHIYPRRNASITSSAVQKAVGSALWQVADTTLTFDLNGKMDHSKIVFNTGLCAGVQFEITAYDPKTKTITFREYADESQTPTYTLPRAERSPLVGDEYVLIDIVMPDEYIVAAKAELKDATVAEIAKRCVPQHPYTVDCDPRYFKSLGFEPRAGDICHLVDTPNALDADVRIAGVEYPLTDKWEVKLTVSDKIPIPTTVIQRKEVEKATDNIVILAAEQQRITRSGVRARAELIDMVFDPEDGNYYSQKIKPNSIETQMLATGAKSMQFVLQNTVIEANYKGDPSQVNITGGKLVHLAMAEQIKEWILANNTVTGLVATTAYYIYAKCQVEGSAGSIILTTDKIKVNADPAYYHFMLGVLNSVVSDEGANPARLVSLTYGASTIAGRFVRTGRIESSGGGGSYFDLDSDRFRVGNSSRHLSYNEDGKGRLVLRGSMTISPSGDKSPLPVWRGPWSNAALYYAGDEVFYAGSTYRCKEDCPASGIMPINVTYWTVQSSKGDHGAKGDYPRYVYLWSDTDTDHPPVRPVGNDPAGWAWNNSREYYIVNSLGQIVTDQSGRAITGRYSSSYRLWASVAYFSGVDDTLIGEWGVPYVQSGLDGRKGKDGIGKDGKSYEYIYRRTTTDVTPATPETAQQDEWTPDQWTDDPMGVDASNLYEWISQRVKTDGAWSVFSTPSIWAKFGKDGNDGKDVAPDTVDKIYSEIDRMAHGFGFDTAMALSEYLKLPMGKIFDYNATTGILKLSTLIAKRIATDEAFINELVITRLRSTGGLVLLDDTQAQFGALRIKTEDGSVSVLDAQGVERVNIKSGNIDSLDTLKNGDSAIGPIYNDSATFGTSTTTELPNKIIVTKNASTLKVLASLNASATIHTSKPISLPYAIITLVLTKNGADFRTLGRAAHDETNHDITGNVGANWSGTVDAGTYGLRLTTRMSQANVGTNTSAQVAQSSMQAGYVERVMRTQIGANGIFSYWNSNKYLYAAENGNGDVFLEVKGKTDMSGVLSKARVDTQGQINKRWGAYTISTTDNISGGEANRRVYHNFPQSGYTAIVTAIGRNAVANVIEEYPNYVDIYATGAFNISLTGDNQ